MRVFSHARLAYKNGANIQMDFVNYVNGTERWASSYWGEDPLGAPLAICRAACAASKPQQSRGLTTHAFSGCRMT